MAEAEDQNDRLVAQAHNLANQLLKLVHEAGESPGVQSTALALALGATIGGYACNVLSLASVLELTGVQVAQQATAHFNHRLQKGEAEIGIPGLDATPPDKRGLH